jgi:catechol 2,3-dioxygenase-like lactoylglutathione lyase family enzyme
MSNAFHSTRDVIIRTPDLRAAEKFYRDVLGLEVTSRSKTVVGFETGAFQLFVEPGEPLEPVFEFLVKDVAATKAQLLAAGCTLVEEDPALPRCYVRDPFGIVFNIGRA